MVIFWIPGDEEDAVSAADTEGEVAMNVVHQPLESLYHRGYRLKQRNM